MEQIFAAMTNNVPKSMVALNLKLDNPFKCVQCPKSFTTKHKLNQHAMTHTGIKPYKCQFCERRFKQLSHVQQHIRLHTGERPYHCPFPNCDRAFTQQSNLKHHIRTHQNGNPSQRRMNPKNFRCPICGKGFTAESSVGIHTSTQHATLLQQDVKTNSTSLNTSTLPGYYFTASEVNFDSSNPGSSSTESDKSDNRSVKSSVGQPEMQTVVSNPIYGSSLQQLIWAGLNPHIVSSSTGGRPRSNSKHRQC